MIGTWSMQIPGVSQRVSQEMSASIECSDRKTWSNLDHLLVMLCLCVAFRGASMRSRPASATASINFSAFSGPPV
jgi:hypothetical protein